MIRKFSVIGIAVVLGSVLGCTGGGGKSQGLDRHAGAQGRNGRSTVPANAVAPMTFSLCGEGLPTTGMWKCDPVMADFNGDGFTDLAALPRLGNGPRVWLGDGKNNWTESSKGLNPGLASCGGGLATADMNRDGYPDLVIGDHCQGVFVFLGDGAGNWQMVTKSLHPDATPGAPADDYLGAEDADVADVNGDGFQDIVAIAQDEGGITLYLGDGTGANWRRQESSSLPSKGWGNRIMFHDLNADGHADIIASMGSGPRVWFGDGKGDWTSASKGLPTPLTHGLFGGIAAADINKDGRIDLAFANWIDGPEVFFQEPDGSWKETPDAFPDMLGGAIGIDLGDIDLDGNLDMLVSGRYGNEVGYVYGLFVLKGDGKGNWQYIRGSQLPETGLSTAWGVAIADVNKDNVPDLVYATGGVVAADERRREPVIPQRVQVWCTQLSNSDKAVLAASRNNP